MLVVQRRWVLVDGAFKNVGERECHILCCQRDSIAPCGILNYVDGESRVPLFNHWVIGVGLDKKTRGQVGHGVDARASIVQRAVHLLKNVGGVRRAGHEDVEAVGILADCHR